MIFLKWRRRHNIKSRQRFEKLLPSGWENWFLEKEFSTDWSTKNYPFWCMALGSLREQTINILEIGSWEGRSATFFLEYLKNSKITCVDTFSGGKENVASALEQKELDFIEGRFDKNLAKYKGRVTKLKGPSNLILAGLVESMDSFRIIYIDGSHERDVVMIDSLLSWKLLERGGFLIWDDYGGGREKSNADRVLSSVDTFLKWHSTEFRLIHRGYQIIIQRI